jgi:hypothetical protein
MSENWRDPIEDRIASQVAKTTEAVRIVESGLKRQMILIRRIGILVGIVAVLEVIRIGLLLYQLAHIQH